MFTILVAEDAPAILKLTSDALRENGYNTLLARDGAEALELLEHHSADLMLLDIMMPKISGLELASQIRGAGMDIPIIMVTAKITAADKRKGFLAGCDDYLTKPYDEEELLLRITALLRRYKSASERRITVGNTELIYDSFQVITASPENSSAAEATELPAKEFMLLFKLLSSPNKTFTRRQLMDDIWGLDSDSLENTVNVHINRLRDRFRENADFEIQTIRGLGYKAVKK